ncbi:hypothetical protein [Actinopolymorpha cephalotaxi]|uniref:Uncharacterized protein n=2 Tax=Actinopolymorpha cephalotaxi TaxID=504797 RepID=A0ABX2RYU6_9ACTN|nr:hypothetical protein [Actinopolymorpha cephalotaxi]NYH81332.1 hypothetical protein [Actinopolymorpha cephalotaxi]
MLCSLPAWLVAGLLACDAFAMPPALTSGPTLSIKPVGTIGGKRAVGGHESGTLVHRCDGV